MGVFNWRSISLLSLAGGYLAAHRSPPFSILLFLLASVGTLLLLLVLSILYYAILYPRFFSPLRHLPAPPDPHWLMGQWPRVAAEPSGFPQRDWVNSVPNDGLIRYGGFLNQERVLATSPRALAEVLVTKSYDFAKPKEIRWSLGRILGVGVLLAEGDEHKHQRKHLMPAFAFRHVKKLYSVFWDKAVESVEVMTDTVRREARDGTAVLEIGEWASRVTLDIIGQAGMGRDFNAIRDPDNYLSGTYRKVFTPSPSAYIVQMLNLVLPVWLVAVLPMKRNQEINSAQQILRETCRSLIRDKRERLARKEPADKDILSVAIESGVFSDENLVDQMMTFLAAGHETTATALLWCVYYMSVFPEMQTRLRNEVRAALPSPSDPGAKVTSGDIDGLVYLNAFCSEVLRYSNPVPLTLRIAVKDTTIADEYIPKGSRVIICPTATNRDVSLWGPSALRFDPERWINSIGGERSESPAAAEADATEADKDKEKRGKMAVGSGGAVSNYAFLSFIHGPRSCMGASFSRGELAALLAAWVGRFEFSLKNGEEADEKNLVLKGVVTLKPAKGLEVRVRTLEGW